MHATSIQMHCCTIFAVFLSLFGTSSASAHERTLPLAPGTPMSVSWTIDQYAREVTIELIAKSRGYLAFGLSQSGSMKGADIAIISMNNATGNFQVGDYYASDFVTPELDPLGSQDFELISASRNSTHTVAQVRRSLITCDTEFDIEINANPLFVMYAFGASDSISKHVFRGSTMLSMIIENRSSLRHQVPSSVYSYPLLGKIPRGTHAIDIVPEEHKLPPETSSYMCMKMNRFESIGTNSTDINNDIHILASTGINMDSHVHHMFLYYCPEDIYNKVPDVSQNCFMPDTGCEVITGWTMGLSTMTLEPHGASMPIPFTDFSRLVLQIHYRRTPKQEQVWVQPGIRLLISDTSRGNDAGVFSVRKTFNSPGIPPHKLKKHTIVSECPQSCINDVSQQSQITIVGAILHAHLNAVSIRVRHIRDDRELENIVRLDVFDFDKQAILHLAPRKVLARDRILVECDYENKSDKVISLGHSINQEMCAVHFVYYPRDVSGITSCGIDGGKEYCGPRFPSLGFANHAADKYIRDISYDKSGIFGEITDTSFTKLNRKNELCDLGLRQGMTNPDAIWNFGIIPTLSSFVMIFFMYFVTTKHFKQKGYQGHEKMAMFLTAGIMFTISFFTTSTLGSSILSGVPILRPINGKIGDPTLEDSLTIFCINIVLLVMVFELFKRENIGFDIIAHHVIVLFVYMICYDAYYRTLNSKWIQLGAIMSYHATTEFPLYFVMVVKHAKTKHNLQNALVYVAVFNFVSKVAILMVTSVLLAHMHYGLTVRYRWLANPFSDTMNHVYIGIIAGISIILVVLNTRLSIILFSMSRKYIVAGKKLEADESVGTTDATTAAEDEETANAMTAVDEEAPRAA